MKPSTKASSIHLYSRSLPIRKCLVFLRSALTGTKLFGGKRCTIDWDKWPILFKCVTYRDGAHAFPFQLEIKH